MTHMLQSDYVMEFVASWGGCLLPSVYYRHIFDNNIKSAGDAER